MLLALLACQSGTMTDHPDDVVKDFVYDTETDPVLPDDYRTTCDDGYIEESREAVFGERLCLSFTNVAPYLGLTDTSIHIGVDTFDHDGDAMMDIFISNANSDSNLYVLKDGAYNTAAQEMGFAYHYEDVAGDVGLSDYRPKDIAAFDFDADGDVDLAIAGDDENFILENSAGTFVTLSSPFSSLSGQNGTSVAWLGSDVVFGTDSGISYFAYTGSSFEGVTEEINITDQDRVGAVAVCDIDADGDKDIFATKEVGDDDRLFVNDGEAFNDVTIPTDGAFSATQVHCTTLHDADEIYLSTTRNGADSVLFCDADYNCQDYADDFGLTSPNNTTAAIYEDLTNEGVTSIFKTNYNGKNELLIPVVANPGTYGYYSDFAVLTGTDFEGQSTGVSDLDFDGDTLTDIVGVAESGDIFLYANKSRFLE